MPSFHCLLWRKACKAARQEGGQSPACSSLVQLNEALQITPAPGEAKPVLFASPGSPASTAAQHQRDAASELDTKARAAPEGHAPNLDLFRGGALLGDGIWARVWSREGLKETGLEPNYLPVNDANREGLFTDTSREAVAWSSGREGVGSTLRTRSEKEESWQQKTPLQTGAGGTSAVSEGVRPGWAALLDVCEAVAGRLPPGSGLWIEAAGGSWVPGTPPLPEPLPHQGNRARHPPKPEQALLLAICFPLEYISAVSSRCCCVLISVK